MAAFLILKLHFYESHSNTKCTSSPTYSFCNRMYHPTNTFETSYNVYQNDFTHLQKGYKNILEFQLKYFICAECISIDIVALWQCVQVFFF